MVQVTSIESKFRRHRAGKYRTALLKRWLLLFSLWGLAGCHRHDPPNLSLAREELGHQLFFDTRLSFNNTKSCASCHNPAFAFSDGYRRSITAGGEMTRRNAPSLLNVSYHHFLNWADSTVVSLEQQHRQPLFADAPPELGLGGNEEKIISRFKNNRRYSELFRVAFPEQEDPFLAKNIIEAIAAYVRLLHSFASPYDRYIAGDSLALTGGEKAGMNLFLSARTGCASCHPPPMFTLADRSSNPDSVFRNNGLYNIGDTGKYPVADPGLALVSGKQTDDGRFKIPSLRNVALTAPYMHDGSVGSMEEVLAIYEAGGRLINTGPDAGDGRKHPNKDRLLKGFTLTAEERLLLIDFLHALTDTTWRTDPRFRNPNRPGMLYGENKKLSATDKHR